MTVLTLYHQSFSEAIFVMKLSNGEKDDLDPDGPRSQSNDLYYLPTKTIILNKVV